MPIYDVSSVPETNRLLWGKIRNPRVPEFSFESDGENPGIHFPSSGEMVVGRRD